MYRWVLPASLDHKLRVTLWFIIVRTGYNKQSDVQLTASQVEHRQQQIAGTAAAAVRVSCGKIQLKKKFGSKTTWDSIFVTCQMSVMWMNGLPGKKEGTKQINREVNRLAIYSGTRGMLWKRHTYLISVMHGILSQNSSGFFSSNWIGPIKERFSMVDREAKLNGWSHLWWWKSWNSGENTIGKW